VQNVLNEDITCLILERLPITDLGATRLASRALRRLTKAVIGRRYRRLLVPYAGEAWQDLVRFLRETQTLITGSSARTMFLGDAEHDMRDLNLVVPPTSFNILDEFLINALGYVCISVISHPAMALGIEQFRKYTKQGKVMTLASPPKDKNVLHTILSAPTTADMIYMTTGGVTCLYPQWLDQRVAICSGTGNLVLSTDKLGCAGELHDELRVEPGTAFIGEACGNRCPTLWHHIQEKRMRKSIDWDLSNSVTKTFFNVDIEWRLNTYCENPACRYNFEIMAGNLETLGAFNRMWTLKQKHDSPLTLGDRFRRQVFARRDTLSPACKTPIDDHMQDS
jgi:hypothetical protein